MNISGGDPIIKTKWIFCIHAHCSVRNGVPGKKGEDGKEGEKFSRWANEKAAAGRLQNYEKV